jgi:hypothetical protein
LRSPLAADVWAKVEALFQEAVDFAASEREAFVWERSGENTQVREEVLTLLAYYDEELPDLLAAALHADAASLVEEVSRKGPQPAEAPRKPKSPPSRTGL